MIIRISTLLPPLLVIAIICLTDAAWARQQYCPDGGPAYFGMCPNNMKPLNAPPGAGQAKPVVGPMATATSLHAQGRYDEAAPYYRQAADQGDVMAMVVLGVYFRGKGDNVTSIGWLRKAAAAGSSAAMNFIGDAYDNGSGVPPDERQAIAWYEKAEEAGSLDAMTELGATYNTPNKEYSSAEKAVYWFTKGSAAGDWQSMLDLARAFDDGKGAIAKDEVKAAYWYRQAAEVGDSSEAKRALGRYYDQGLGGLPKDPAQAAAWRAKIK